MFIRGMIASLLMLAPFAAQAQVPDTVTFAPPSPRTDTYPAHMAKFGGGVTGIPDIVYASYSGYRPLTLDLYLPPEGSRPNPLVIYAHGGSFHAADSRFILGIDDFPAALASLAARGYAVASVNYRLSGEAHFPAQIQDVKAAIAFLRANAAKYHIDPARAVAWGVSSGGQLAALVAESCGKAEFAPLPSNSRPILPDVARVQAAHVSDCVQGAVIWYGDMDLNREAPDPALEPFLGCSPCGKAELAATSPINFVTTATPPMLLVNGIADPAIPVAEAAAMARRLTEAGVPVQTLLIPDVGHGFIGKTPEITRAANARALARTAEFIDALFSKAAK